MRQLKILLIILVVITCSLTGCKKKTTESEKATQTKTAEQYNEQAKKEITEKNMDEEFKKLEQEIQSETESEQ